MRTPEKEQTGCCCSEPRGRVKRVWIKAERDYRMLCRDCAKTYPIVAEVMLP